MALTKLKDAKILAEKFNKLSNDLDRIKFIQGNNDALGVMLDNDQTQVRFLLDEDLEYEEVELFNDISLDTFDEFCGDDDLTFIMWEALGIEAESV